MIISQRRRSEKGYQDRRLSVDDLRFCVILHKSGEKRRNLWIRQKIGLCKREAEWKLFLCEKTKK